MSASAGTLVGRHAFVMGAGSGIGRHIALGLAAAGADVTLAGRSVERLEATTAEVRDLGVRTGWVVADAAVADQVERVVASAESDRGPLDVVVANSGVVGPTAPLHELDPADWDATIRVNLTGPFLLCRAVLPGMLRRGAGSIVVTGSITGKRPLANRSPYAASKAGLIGLVRTLADEVGPHGVRVNLVSPGSVSGERFDRVVAAQAAASGVSEDEVRARFASGALRRPVTPEEVASVVTFLAGPGASAMTGQDLNVSAGLVMHG